MGLHLKSPLVVSANPLSEKVDNILKMEDAGAGIDLGNIGIHARISRGLKSIGEKQTVSDYVGSLKNAAWAITLSYGF